MSLAPAAPRISVASAHAAGDRLDDGADAAAELIRVAANEAARGIGLVELVAPNAKRRGAVAVERLVGVAVDQGIRVEHQVAAHLAGRVGESVGEAGGGGIQQEARRADAIAGDDDHLRRLELLDAVGIVVDRARGHAVFIRGDFAHSAARAQFDAGADRVRPVSDVRARLRPLRAAERAVREMNAGRARRTRWWRRWFLTATSTSRACSLRGRSANALC